MRMTKSFDPGGLLTRVATGILVAVALTFGPAIGPAAAQDVEQFDPDEVYSESAPPIDSDLVEPEQRPSRPYPVPMQKEQVPTPPLTQSSDPRFDSEFSEY